MAFVFVPTNLFFTDVEISIDRGSATSRSPFTGKRQTRKRPYDIWRFKGGLMPLDPEDAGSMKSFLMQLAGQTNWFRLKVPGSKYPLSKYAGPQGTVLGGGQTGRSILTTGWAIGATILKEGDHFNIGEELKVATATIAANGLGQATISFEPPLRSAPSNNTNIWVFEPTVLLSADDDDVASWKITPPIRHAFKLAATEHF